MCRPMVPVRFWRGAPLLLSALAASASLAGDFQTFADALSERGWQVQQDANADLLLYPNAGLRQTAEVTMLPRSDTGIDGLAKRLAATGWNVEHAADGSILFWANSSTNEQTATNTAPHTDRGLGALRDHLAATGWVVERRTDGHILLWRAAGSA
jgi:hypothetical protein